MAKLRCLTIHCDFENYLDQALRDRLVCFLCEVKLTLALAIKLAQGMEAAHQNIQFMKKAQLVSSPMNESQQVVLINMNRVRKRIKCYHCSKHGHAATDCTFKDSKCQKCGKKATLQKSVNNALKMTYLLVRTPKMLSLE